jgi:hypothetical protein
MAPKAKEDSKAIMDAGSFKYMSMYDRHSTDGGKSSFFVTATSLRESCKVVCEIS